jgi:TetR/AcrR family transcriptional regulator
LPQRSILTEERIIRGAREEFVEKGFAGARMRSIANRSGVNVALLNYYFRSKQRLFETVFAQILGPMVNNLLDALQKEDTILITIENFIRCHYRFVQQHPEGPLLIAKELTGQSSSIGGPVSRFLLKRIKQSGIPYQFTERIRAACEAGIIRQVDPIQLLVSILSLNIMHVIIKPIYTSIFADQIGDNEEFVKQREDEIVALVLASLCYKSYEQQAGDCL